MKSIKDVLKDFDPLHDKYISREYQGFGVYLSEKLSDSAHKSMYIRFARDIPRPILEAALRFVIDSNAKNRAALFMWKLKEMGAFQKTKGKVITEKRKSKIRNQDK